MDAPPTTQLSDEEGEEDHYLLRGLLYFLGWVAILLILHTTAPVNNPTASTLVSLFWFLLATISVSIAWYFRVGRAGRHLKGSPPTV